MDPQQMQAQQAQAMHMMAAIMPIFFLIALIGLAVLIVPLWKICTKAGLSGPLALLTLIPFGMIIVLYVIAFSEWRLPLPPQALGYQPPYPPPPPTYMPPPPAA